MLDEATAGAAAPIVRTTKILVAVQTVALFATILIMLLVQLSNEGDANESPILGISAVLIAIVAMSARTVVSRLLAAAAPTPPSEAEIESAEHPEQTIAAYAKSWQSRQIVRAAILEGAALLCVILGFVGPWWAALPGVGLFVLLAFSIPTAQHFADDAVAARQSSILA